MKNLVESEEIYRKLQEHLDQMPVGFPATQSGVEIRILKHLFTPEEANTSLNLSTSPEALNKIYRRFKDSGISKEELEQKLDILVKKGLILGGGALKFLGDRKFYCLSQWVVGIFEFQLNRLTKEFVEDYEEYLYGDFLNEYLNPKTPFQFRTIPIEKSVSVEQQISTYDDLRKIIENSKGPFSVANCICKQERDLLGHSCTITDLRETCIQLEGTALHYIELGYGREITKEEMFRILHKGQEAGLVLNPFNAQNPLSICICCGDCCQIITSLKKFPKPANLIGSNFYAEVDFELCEGCETCTNRCQMDAISLKDNISSVDLNRCIGCGNCVVSCPSNAIHLVKKEIEIVPPKDAPELLREINIKKVSK